MRIAVGEKSLKKKGEFKAGGIGGVHSCRVFYMDFVRFARIRTARFADSRHLERLSLVRNAASRFPHKSLERFHVERKRSSLLGPHFPSH